MLRAARARARREEGFTLIELMVVVLVIAILVAVGLPTLFGARSRAQDGAAKANLRTALSAEMVFYGAEERFSGDNTAGGDLDSIEPNLEWGTLLTTDNGVIASVTGPGDNTVILRTQSDTGVVFCLGRIADTGDAGTYYTTGCDGTEGEPAVAAWGTTPASGGW